MATTRPSSPTPNTCITIRNPTVLRAPDSPLPRYLAVAYTLLVIYASLHPFSGWRDSGAPAMGYLTAAWPRYYTVFDLVTNVAAYVPLGFIWVPTLQGAQQRWLAPVTTILLVAALSFSMETIQNFLPSRVPSNVDLGCNSLGGVIGALLGARWGVSLLSGGRLHRLRERMVVAGNGGDAGLVLMALWLLTQVNPETLLFGSGDLRHLLGLEIALPFDIDGFKRIEAGVTAINTLAVGLVTASLLRHRHGGAILALFVVALSVRALSFELLVEPAPAFRWITPGNSIGFLIGLILLVPTLRLISPLRRALAGSALLCATVLVNLAPENPYLIEAAQVWRQGHFLNFNGLTRLASVLWPFLALPWLLLPERDPWKK